MAIDADQLQRDLDLRLLGEQFFLQALDQLSRADLDQPSSLPGWTRKHVAAHVIHNAEAFMRLLEWARTGEENRMYPSRQARDEEIGSTVAHTSNGDVMTMAHEVVDELSDEFDDMDDEAWSATVVNGQGKDMQAAQIPWARARETWMHSLDLNIGMTTLDFPAAMVNALLDEITGMWIARDEPVNYKLNITDRDGSPRMVTAGPEGTRPAEPIEVTGEAAEIVSYLTGRGWPNSGVEDNDKGASGAATPLDLPAPPPWI